MLARRLQMGDEIRIIAPSTTMAVLKGKLLENAKKRLEDLGFVVTYGKNVNSYDEFYRSSVEKRLEDLHEAFTNKKVKAVIMATGGFHCNQLLHKIDYELIRNNPKIICGYGDSTALLLAIYKNTNLRPYYGPNFDSFGDKLRSDYMLQSFLAATTNDAPVEIEPSEFWSNDPWHAETDERELFPVKSYAVITEGEGEGVLIGGNLTSLNLLKGSKYFPSFKNSVLFLEEDEQSHPFMFERDLQALLHTIDIKEIKALLIGRFQKASNMTDLALETIIKSFPHFNSIPVISNVNFGHVDPIASLPIGGQATINTKAGKQEIFIEL